MSLLFTTFCRNGTYQSKLIGEVSDCYWLYYVTANEISTAHRQSLWYGVRYVALTCGWYATDPLDLFQQVFKTKMYVLRHACSRLTHDLQNSTAQAFQGKIFEDDSRIKHKCLNYHNEGSL